MSVEEGDLDRDGEADPEAADEDCDVRACSCAGELIELWVLDC